MLCWRPTERERAHNRHGSRQRQQKFLKPMAVAVGLPPSSCIKMNFVKETFEKRGPI